MTDRVEVDTSGLDRALRQLAVGIDRAASSTAMSEATRTANQVRQAVPRRSGRLAATVRAVPVDGGGAVTYGGSLPYAHYIEGRSHAVADALDGTAARFGAAMQRAAALEVGRI